MKNKKIEEMNKIIWIFCGFFVLIIFYLDYQKGGIKELFFSSIIPFTVFFFGSIILMSVLKWFRKRKEKDNK